MNFGRRRREDSRIDLTPLIDVIFQLVLFFMVSTTFVTTPGIEVELPESNADAILRENRDINIWMTSEGSVFVDDSPVDQDELERLLDERSALEEPVTVVIKADQEVGHGRVVEVMELARERGLVEIAIATEAPLHSGGVAPSSRPATEDR